MHAARRTVIRQTLIALVFMLPGLGLGLYFAGWGGALPFTAAGLAVLVLLLVLMLVWQRADARRAALLATGVRVPAVLVSSRPTRTRVKNRAIMAHTFEARLPDGVLRVEDYGFAHLPVGTTATIAYDTTDSSKAVVVEDLDEAATAGQPDWQALKRQQLDRTFRKRQ